MVIEKIEIDGFGIYNDFLLENLKKGVNIILGNNEAGKTTLLKFMRYTLFGYPRLKENRMTPLRGGAHGGRIMGTLGSGQPVTIERKGSNNLSVWPGNEQFDNDNDLFRLLGHATPSLFSNVYAITLDELVGLASLSESGVDDKIFSVGLGLGSMSLAETESEIRNRIGDIYKSAGRNQQIPEILKYIAERKDEISEKQTYLPRRSELAGELSRIEQETSEFKNRYRENLSAKNRLENYLKCYESVVIVVNAEKELEELPASEILPEDGLRKMDLLESKINDLNEQLEKLESGDGEEKGICNLKDLTTSVNFNRALLDKSVKVEFLKSNLNGYRNVLLEYSQGSSEIKRLQQQYDEIVANLNADSNEGDISGYSSSGIHKAAIRSFRNQIEELARRRIAAETYKDALRHHQSRLNLTNIAVVLSVLFLIGSIPLFYYSLYIPAGAMVASATLLFAGRKYMVKESPLIAVENEMGEIINEKKRITESFSDYIAGMPGMPGSVTIETAEEVLAGIEMASGILRQKRLVEEKQAEQRKPFIDQFESVAGELIPLLEREDDTVNYELITKRIISEFDSSREQWNRKTALDDELNRKTREADNIKRIIEETNAGICGLLKAADATDKEEYLKKYSLNEKIARLVEAKNNAFRTIESVAGIGEAPEVVSFFKTTGKEKLAADINDLSLQSEDMEQKIGERERRTGELKSEINGVEEDSDMTVAMTGLETGRHNLKSALIEWLSGRFALEMLNEVRTGYEREKQPAVINNAARFFSAVTDGRYNRLHVSMGDKDVKVYDGTGVFKTTGQLSRGAKEQLLLSLRLGFIEEYEKQAEPLPLVVDEVLVNFDPGRARRMAEVLHEFSVNRQLLLFSCHPETQGLFEGMDINLITLK